MTSNRSDIYKKHVHSIKSIWNAGSKLTLKQRIFNIDSLTSNILFLPHLNQIIVHDSQGIINPVPHFNFVQNMGYKTLRFKNIYIQITLLTSNPLISLTYNGELCMKIKKSHIQANV